MWSSGYRVRLVVGRRRVFDFFVESDQRLKNLLFTASLLDIQHLEMVWR